MKKIIVMLTLAVALFTGAALAPANGLAGKGGFTVQDSCAASFIQDASACGNGGWVLIGEWWGADGHWCTYRRYNNGVYQYQNVYAGWNSTCPSI